MSTSLYQIYSNRTPSNGHAFHLLAKGSSNPKMAKLADELEAAEQRLQTVQVEKNQISGQVEGLDQVRSQLEKVGVHLGDKVTERLAELDYEEKKSIVQTFFKALGQKIRVHWVKKEGNTIGAKLEFRSLMDFDVLEKVANALDLGDEFRDILINENASQSPLRCLR